MKNKYMEEALKEAKKSFDMEEIPVGAVIVCNDEIIARAHNLKEHNKCATAHAEILAIEQACKKIGDWRLNDCTLYVTLEPCLMCCGALLQARIKKIVYAAANAKFGYVESIDKLLSNSKNNHIVEIQKVDCPECLDLLQQFFQKKRSSTLISKSKSV